MRIDILPNYFLNSDGTYDKDSAIKLCGKIAGVCYDKEGFNHLANEKEVKTLRRVDMTLNNGHHSVYDHAYISFNMQNIPKILAMIINNEKEYTTSEKSLRYTPVVSGEDSSISSMEVELYNKWVDKIYNKIKEVYGTLYDDKKIKKLAYENARYMVTIFIPTQMIYTTSLRQINYIASWMEKFILESDKSILFNRKLSSCMQDFIDELDRLNVLEDGLLKNEKSRGLSIFGNDLEKKEEYFGNVYSTKYLGSFAMFAQAQRHRTISYQLELLDDKKYFVPPIIMDDEKMVNEWLSDINGLGNVYPMGELLLISEEGVYDNFILKCKERLCTDAQLEIMLQTRDTLLRYKAYLEGNNHYLKDDIKYYTNGARCTFKDFRCSNDCMNKSGKLLQRKI